MKMQTTNETLLSEAINSSVDYADWSAAVVEDPAAAHGSFRRAEYDPVLTLCGRAAADASHTAALLSSRGATAFPGTRNGRVGSSKTPTAANWQIFRSR